MEKEKFRLHSELSELKGKYFNLQREWELAKNESITLLDKVKDLTAISNDYLSIFNTLLVGYKHLVNHFKPCFQHAL